MTGFRPNPSSGYAIDRMPSPKADYAMLARSLGVEKDNIMSTGGYSMDLSVKQMYLHVLRPEQERFRNFPE